MIPGTFEYFAPATLEEAIGLLERSGSDARPLAGGQSLIPLMKFRLAKPRVLVDLSKIPTLTGIQELADYLCIGAMTRHALLEESEIIHFRYPLIADAAAVIADPLIRNRGTTGGSMAHADPAGDLGAVMMALGAQVVVVGPQGQRTLSVDDLLVGPFMTSLEPSEVISNVHVPIPMEQSAGAYVKLERRAGDFATAAVAVQLMLRDGICQQIGIALTAVGPTNIRAVAAENFLRGGRIDEHALNGAADAAAQEAQPVSDLRGPVEYKRDMIRVLTLRALQLAIERATQQDRT